MLNENFKLSKMIENYRACKTISEEREFINRERAIIRNNIINWDIDKKASGLLKLVWINMIGFETEFS